MRRGARAGSSGGGAGRARILLVVAVLLLVGQLSGAGAEPPGGCLKYEPAEVELRGVIARETFPGRPNYESVEAGDEPETVWVLTLHAPVCVDGAGGEDPNVAERDVRQVQLVLSREQYAACAPLVGKRVRVCGSLFHAITGHHHKDVLMTVRRIGAET
jgi:hypothetical protein